MAENKWVTGATRLSGAATLPITGRGPLCTQSFNKQKRLSKGIWNTQDSLRLLAEGLELSKI